MYKLTMTDSLQLIVILHLIAGAVCLEVIQEADPAEISNDDALVSVKENIKQNGKSLVKCGKGMKNCNRS